MLLKMRQENLFRVVYACIFILLLVTAFNIFGISGLKSRISYQVEKAAEAAKPAELELIKISSSCLYCFNPDETISKLKGADLKIISEKEFLRSSAEAEELIGKYGIDRLPAVLLRGEIEKVSLQDFNKRQDALVFEGIIPPYENASGGNIIGKVSLIIINDENCGVCTNLTSIIPSLRQNGVFIDKEELLSSSGQRGKGLISSLGISKLPALLMSRDIDKYPAIAESVAQLPKKGGYYIFESQPPYVDADSGKIMGLVRLIILDDRACTECYNVTLHREILQAYGIFVANESTYDVSSEKGKALLEKYSITSAPTIILSPEAAIYGSLKRVWGSVGTAEKDGWLVFRATWQMGTYMNLSSGKVVSK